MPKNLRLLLASAAVMVIMAAFSLAVTATTTGSTAPVARADLLVRLRPGACSGDVRALLSADSDMTPLVPELDIYHLRSPLPQDVARASLQRSPCVLYAEPNQTVHASLMPNDPDYASRQWALGAIRAPQAWDIITGSNAITIAIIDTGIDIGHPDLAAKIVTGTTFVTGSGSARDDHGHGTHVAGIAAASTNNGIGMAGVSWGARLMPVKVLDKTGSGTYAELINGIYYAASHGAQILNMSLEAGEYSQALQDAIDYAYDEGVLLVASAGNCALGGVSCAGINPVMYPAANEHVLSVAATDEQDRRASFSTRNAFVDVAAPGVGIYSTHWQSGVSTYFWMSGTSQAAPHVAGLAALIWSARPWLRNTDVEAVLENTARDVNAAQYPGRDDDLGWGRIDAQRAVDRTPPVSAVSVLPAAQRDPMITVTWGGEDENSGLRYYAIQSRDGGGPWLDWMAGVTRTQAVFAGQVGHIYFFQSSATDWAGNAEQFPGGDGDTHISISTCTLSGEVRDNRDVAVAGARVALEPDGSSALTDESGQYTLVPAACGGTYALAVERDGFGAVLPARGVVVTPSTAFVLPDLFVPPIDNLLRDRDWGFESGVLTTAWSIGGLAPAIAPDHGHTGSCAAFLGTPMTATSPGGESSIAVTVTVPITMYRPTLSFLYRILTMDNGLHDYFEVQVNGQPAVRDSYAGPDYGSVRDLGWRHGWVDLGPYAGQQVEVRLAVVQGMAYASYPTGAYVDEVSVGSAAGGRIRAILPLILMNQ